MEPRRKRSWSWPRQSIRPSRAP